MSQSTEKPEGVLSGARTTLYEKIDWDAYSLIQAASNSGLRDWVTGSSPKGRNLTIGSALHCALLEDKDAISSRYHFTDSELDLRIKDDKEKWSRIAQENPGKIIIRPHERKLIRAMAAAVLSHRLAAKAIKGIEQAEVSLLAEPKGCAERIKGRLDGVCKKSIVDLKTSGFPDSSYWKQCVIDYGYASAGALYSDLWAVHSGERLPVVFVVVSSRPPHCVWVERLTSEQEAFGRQWYEHVFKLYERYGQQTEGEL